MAGQRLPCRAPTPQAPPWRPVSSPEVREAGQGHHLCVIRAEQRGWGVGSGCGRMGSPFSGPTGSPPAEGGSQAVTLWANFVLMFSQTLRG